MKDKVKTSFRRRECRDWPAAASPSVCCWRFMSEITTPRVARGPSPILELVRLLFGRSRKTQGEAHPLPLLRIQADAATELADHQTINNACLSG